jgi:hypothetical protein
MHDELFEKSVRSKAGVLITSPVLPRTWPRWPSVVRGGYKRASHAFRRTAVERDSRETHPKRWTGKSEPYQQAKCPAPETLHERAGDRKAHALVERQFNILSCDLLHQGAARFA